MNLQILLHTYRVYRTIIHYSPHIQGEQKYVFTHSTPHIQGVKKYVFRHSTPQIQGVQKYVFDAFHSTHTGSN